MPSKTLDIITDILADDFPRGPTNILFVGLRESGVFRLLYTCNLGDDVGMASFAGVTVIQSTYGNVAVAALEAPTFGDVRSPLVTNWVRAFHPHALIILVQPGSFRDLGGLQCSLACQELLQVLQPENGPVAILLGGRDATWTRENVRSQFPAEYFNEDRRLYRTVPTNRLGIARVFQFICDTLCRIRGEVDSDSAHRRRRAKEVRDRERELQSEKREQKMIRLSNARRIEEATSAYVIRPKFDANIQLDEAFVDHDAFKIDLALSDGELDGNQDAESPSREPEDSGNIYSDSSESITDFSE